LTGGKRRRKQVERAGRVFYVEAIEEEVT